MGYIGVTSPTDPFTIDPPLPTGHLSSSLFSRLSEEEPSPVKAKAAPQKGSLKARQVMDKNYGFKGCFFK